MKKRVVSVDVDDVLFDLNGAIRRWHNHRYGTSYKLKDVKSFNLCDSWGCSFEESLRRLDVFYGEGGVSRLKIRPGARQILEQFRNKFCYIANTSRPIAEAGEATRISLEQHFPGLFEDCLFARGPFPSSQNQPEKLEICQQIGAVCHLEDGDHFALACAEAGIPVVQFKRPWNGNVSHPLILTQPPIASWRQAPEYLTKLAGGTL